MRVLVSGYTYRTIDSIRPVLDRIVQLGGTVDLMLFPYLTDANAHYLNLLPYPQLLKYPLYWFTPEHLPFATLVALVARTVDASKPDVVISDCIEHYPGTHLKQALIEAGFPDIPLVVTQQDFLHPWKRQNDHFHCDAFFCYGPALKDHLRTADHQPQVFPVGLPRFERLKQFPTKDHGYILYLPKAFPRWSEIKPGIETAALQLGLPILVKPHPMYPSLYSHDMDSETTTLAHPDIDTVPLIAHASLVVTSGTTSALDVLWLGKPLVVIPSPSSDTFPKDLFVTQDFSSEEILRVFRSYQENLPAIEAYLLDQTGGRAFDSVNRFLEALDQVVSSHPMSLSVS